MLFKNAIKPASFTEGEQYSFYCAECDNAVIDSSRAGTGTFYYVFTHSRDRVTPLFTKEYKFKMGEYRQNMFALCPDCDHLKKNTQ